MNLSPAWLDVAHARSYLPTLALLTLALAAPGILVAASAADSGVPPLDFQGSLMLDPHRRAELDPSALVERLALPAGAHVADVGAGPGFLTLVLAQAVPEGRVIATDINPDYLAVVANRARHANLRNVETRRVPAEHPLLASASVDLALLCQVDHYLADRQRYFAELVPALRPGGRIAVVNFEPYQPAVEAAGRQVGWRVTDSWSPSPGVFLLVFSPAPAVPRGEP